MDLWIDYTSLHSAYLCTRGRGRGELDVDDFLQLSINLIFSDRLFVSGYVTDYVLNKTKEIIDFYNGRGLDTNTIQIIDHSHSS